MRGHTRKRGTKWCFVIDVGRDENGKRIRKWFSGFDTKRDAEKAMAARVMEIESGGYVIAKKETVDTYILRWLIDKQAQVRYGTYRKYEWLVKTHIVPRIGKYELSKLRPTHLQTLYATLRLEAGLSQRSILHTHRLIHEALNRTVKWGLVARNVADAVETPRAERFNAPIWTPEEVYTFLQMARGDRYWIAYFLAIMTGMRQGEVLGLQWSDIDWENGYLRIQRTQNYVRGQPVFRDLKTDRSRRSVALSPDTLDALRQHRTVQASEQLALGPLYQDHNMVVTNEVGAPLSQNTLAHAWLRAVKDSGQPRIRFHDLRHTHASLLLQQGVHPKVVSERLGHSNISITLDTYSHVLPTLQHAAANEFDRLLSGTKNTAQK